LYLQQLHIINYKNYQEARLSFSPKLNLVVGPNGSGKTNLLDAIYYMCFCKSYFNSSDSHNIRHKASFFRIESLFLRQNVEEKIIAKVAQRRKKEISCNDAVYKKFSEHIGLLPLVIIAPDDVGLVKGGSEERRKLIDTTLSQFNKTYLQQLIQYNKILQQRNTLLKQFAESHTFNSTLLHTYNEQLAPLGTYIHGQRKQFVQQLLPLLQRYYAHISGGKEIINCRYKSPLNEQVFTQLLLQSEATDRQLQRTHTGTHRDDLVFFINEYPLKKFGSQGQQKSFLIALKLAIYTLIQQQKNRPPILLLDDIFDKLDYQRITQLIETVIGNNFGQVFISDTQLDRLQRILEPFKTKYKVFDVSDSTNIEIKIIE